MSRDTRTSLESRIRCKPLRDRIVTPEAAAALIKDGMTIGMSGFTKAGDAKAVPLAMAERAATEKFRITLLTGAAALIVWRTRMHLLWLLGAGALLGAVGFV